MAPIDEGRRARRGSTPVGAQASGAPAARSGAAAAPAPKASTSTKPPKKRGPAPPPTPPRKPGGASSAAAKASPNPQAPTGGAAPRSTGPRPTAPGARRFIDVAEVARPHGLRGELRLKVYNEHSDLLLRRPKVVLRMQDGSERETAIDIARAADRAVLVKFAGVDDRDASEALRGAVVTVPRDLFPALEDGEFYACDLEGAVVVLVGSADAVGRVEGIQSYPSCDVLLVAQPAQLAEDATVARPARTIEVPLVDAYVASVDVAAARVELHTIDGLE